MKGVFGVFDGLEVIAQFAEDDAADEYRRSALELDRAPGFRRSQYDDLQIHEIPEDLDCAAGWRMLVQLKRSRTLDVTVEHCLGVLHRAQHERAMMRRAAA